MRPFLLTLLVLLAALVSSPGATRAEEPRLVVFAAASLKNALDDVGERWVQSGHRAPALSYAGSSALAKQIIQGAPADLFISANQQWMDSLQKAGLLQEGTRVDLLSNSLVLIAPVGEAPSLTIGRGFDLVAALRGGRLAMANTDAVPAGIYGREALTSLGVWDGVKDHLAQAQDVRAALALVARGEAPLGIVYATDAVAEPGVTVVGTFPADSHTPIVYPAAALRDSGAGELPRAFLTFLGSPQAVEAFRKQGFTVRD